MTFREQLEIDAQRFGERTCGCTALYRHITRYMTPNGKSEHAAWPLCPRCLGLGIDMGMTRGAHV